ncbi:MAG: TIGR03986 family CRISPR-associated RAMP protein [Terriglobia bacterium]
MNFLNPYHFVPVVPGARPGDIPAAKIHETPKLDHSRYGASLHSGEIRCSLKTITPVVAGGKQPPPPNATMRVFPYKVVAETGEELPAIAGSSLRGMVSAIAEAASNSALRVLESTSLSYHRSMRDPAPSAIGVVQCDSDGQWFLRPLCIPFLRENHGKFQLPAQYQRYFPLASFPGPMLRVYVGTKPQIRDPALFTFRTRATGTRPLANLTWGPGYTLPASNPALHVRNSILLGQWEQTGQPMRDGIYRVLGCWGSREDKMPTTKAHELFLPLPPKEVLNTLPSFVIPNHVVSRFEQLADERTEDSLNRRRKDPSFPLLPFELLDRPRSPDPRDPWLRLQDLDLVYFSVDAKREIDEISFSAIWRFRPENSDHSAATSYHFFAAVDPNLVPFNGTRTLLTPAEQLFGFVATEQREDKAAALAGRLRFSDALPAPGSDFTEAFLREVTLKILSSPKLPCPSLYFQPQNGQRIRKRDLRPGASRPQGRKFYLHHRVPEGETPWETQITDEKTADQKMRVTPLRRKLHFEFTIRFDNLDTGELNLLLYSLHPETGFLHKLGMGKPLGLGSVELGIEQIGLVNRQTRYTVEGLVSPRHTALTPQEIEQRIAEFRKSMNADIRKAIALLGTPPPGLLQIHTPQIEGANLEQETFLWFVANDVGLTDKPAGRRIPEKQEGLAPLKSMSTELPPLERYRWEPIPKR